ncbi:MAG TPA: redoxin domain-containing protein [Polyangiaceae bacterium]|nr:redoxin domain-containing protein [Polyangiaceae bacterium]
MRASAWLLGALVTLGCSSEAIPQGDGTSTPAPGPAPATTSTASAVEGDFAPVQAYPAGPYGHGVGAVIENVEFYGWRDPVAVDYDSSQLEPIKLGDYYDPNGTQTEIIVLNAAAVWCTVCQAEMRDMHNNGTYQAFLARKAQVFGTLFQDAGGNPAQPQDLTIWASASTRQIPFPLVLDPALKMGIYFASDATPLNLVIDARTMRILDVMMGYDSTPGTGLWGIVDGVLKSRGL